MSKFIVIFLTLMLYGFVFLSACSPTDTETDTSNENEEITEEEQQGTDEAVDNVEEDQQEITEETDDEKNESETETEEIVEQNETDDTQTEIVMENEAFRIYEPAPNSEVDNEFTVRGEARVFEGIINYEFEDGHFIFDMGQVTASQGTPEWGEFEIHFHFEEFSSESGRVILYEDGPKDGERLNELDITLYEKE